MELVRAANLLGSSRPDMVKFTNSSLVWSTIRNTTLDGDAVPERRVRVTSTKPDDGKLSSK